MTRTTSSRTIANIPEAVGFGRLVAPAAMLFVAAFCCLSAVANGPPAVRVLIVTGQDPAHDWRKTSPVVRATLEQDPRIEARIVEDPEFLAAPLLADYDVILLEFANLKEPGHKVVPLRRQAEIEKNLTAFVAGGKGLVVLHFSCAALADWTEFADLAGRVWDRKTYHDPRGPFTVKIVDHEHPITRGLEDFQADDELYVCQTGTAKLKVLATARSTVTGREYAMALAMPLGKGRVFNTPLGHDGRAVAMPGTAKLLQRGCLWAAGKLEP